MKRFAVLFVLVVLALSACSSSPAPETALKEQLLGTWFGTTDTAAGTQKTTFKLARSNDLIAGVAELVAEDTESGEVTAADIGYARVSINDDAETITVDVSFTPRSENANLEDVVTYLYQGEITGTTFSGAVLRLVDGVATTATGEFSLNKRRDTTTIR